MKITEEKVWLKYYDEEAINMELPKYTAYSYLKKTNRDHLDNTALNYYGKKITFRELFYKIEECAKAFSVYDLKPGDIVSFVAVAVPECIIAIYALNKLGVAANTIDPRLAKEDICRMVKESDSRLMVTLDIAFPKIKPIMQEINQERIIVLSPTDSLPPVKKAVMKLKTKTDVPYGEDVISWKNFMEAGKKTVAIEAPYEGDATVAIAYTGGTTGFPKGVMLTNDSMNAVAFNFRNDGLEYEPGQKFLGIIPVFSSYGMVCGMHMPLCMGCELVPVPGFVPATIGKLVKQFRPNHMISTPAFYEILINSKEMEGMDLSFLITMGSGGDSMNAGLEEKLNQFMKSHNIKYPLAQGYGMSELSAAATFCVNDRYKRGSVGIPSLTTTVGIFDPKTGEELGYNQKGEVCVTGPSVMKGYFKRPAETAHVMRLHDDGNYWIHSGDIGYMDEDGFVYIKGRVKRMITRFDGHKVFPINLESLVAEHKEVHNCAVVGVDDRGHSQGQYPIILVELFEGSDRKAVCKEIFDQCQQSVEERGKPVAVVALDKIPLTGMGKNDYRTMEREFKFFDYTNWDPMA